MEMDRVQMSAVLERVVRAFFPEGIVPPADGGKIFREICEERRRHGDMFWTERRLHDLARDLGFWPWSVNQISASFRGRTSALDPAPIPAAPILPCSEELERPSLGSKALPGKGKARCGR